MKFLTRVFAVLCAMFVLTGCFEQKITYTINPDGSGKADISYITPLAALNSKVLQMDNAAPPPPLNEQLRAAAAKIIKQTTGADAWGNIKYTFTQDGQIHFQGTAYFADFNKFHFNKSKNGDEDDQKNAHGDGLQLKVSKNSLKLVSVNPERNNKKSSSGKKQSLLQNKVDYQNAKAMMRMLLYDMKITSTYILPGKVMQERGFKKLNANTVTFTIDGKQILKIIDDMAMNDKYSKDAFEMSKNMEIYSLMPNMEKNLEVQGAMQPLFNYKKELIAAKQKWKKFEKVLSTHILAKGEKTVKIPTKINSKAEVVKTNKHAKLVGSKYSLKGTAEEQKDFYLYQDSLEVNIVQPLPSKATVITKALVTKAEMMDGENVLGKKKWDRKISFPRLAKDGKSVMLGIKLKIPKHPNVGLKVVEGKIEYQNSSGEKIIDLGLLPLKQGAKGKQLGANIIIAKGKKHNFMSAKTFALQLKVNKHYVIGVEFYDKNGKKITIKPAGTSWSDGSVTYNFVRAKSLPDRLGIKVKMYTISENKTMLFSLKNIDLFGHQIAK